MNLQELYKKYPLETYLIVLGGLLALIWYLLLSFLSLALSWQATYLNKQRKQLEALSALPSHWQNQVASTDITDLIALLSKNWQSLMPKYKDVVFEQVNKTELRSRVAQIDEQAFMQWLWAMQKQYPFKIVQCRFLKNKQNNLVNAVYILQII
jgi:energy-coupling factor transporter transmembrane protein EcfT